MRKGSSFQSPPRKELRPYHKLRSLLETGGQRLNKPEFCATTNRLYHIAMFCSFCTVHALKDLVGGLSLMGCSAIRVVCSLVSALVAECFP